MSEDKPEYNKDDEIIDLDERDESPQEEEEESEQEQQPEVSSSTPDEDKKELPPEPTYLISIPSTLGSKLEKLIDKMSEMDDTESESRARWASALTESTAVAVEDNYLDELGDNSSERWTRDVSFNDTPLTPFEPQIRDVTGKKLSGHKAITVLEKSLGLGTKKTFPLWHSGMWVTLSTPSESDLLNLFIAISNLKTEFGTSTAGVVFSNMGVVINQEVANFIAGQLYGTSVKGINADNIFDYVKVQDFYPIILCMVSAMYPTGFEYRRPCTNKVEECDHVEYDRIVAERLYWVDKSKLTDKQRKFMSQRRLNSVSLEAMKDYQETLADNAPETVTLESSTGGKIILELRNPNVTQHVEAGLAWVEDLSSMLEGILDQETDKRLRKHYIEKHAELIRLREYSHYIHSVEFDGNVVEDRATIDEILNRLSSDTKLVTNIHKEIQSFINRTAMSVVGIPEYDCPICSQPQGPSEKNSRHPDIIPLDSLYSFFTLARLKIKT